MTLGQLLYEINDEYKKICNELEPYRYIPEVDDFLNLRKQDLESFKEFVSKYKVTADVAFVQADLRKRNAEIKFYGGICSRKREYFKVTNSIKKIIEEFEELANEDTENKSRVLFDKDFAIFDELAPDQVAQFMEE